MKILDVPQSGSEAGITSSRNRYGQYRRTRAVPVNRKTAFQLVVRNRMSLNSAAWRTITDAQRAGWEDLAAQSSRSDALGQSYNLNGFGAYCSINNNRLAAGDAVVADAPALAAPLTLTSVTLTLTAAAFSIAFTPTPTGAGVKLFIYASPQRPAGRSFNSDFRLIQVSTAAQASPVVALAAYTARFGVPVVGNRVFLSIATYTLGFRSGPFQMSQVVA